MVNNGIDDDHDDLESGFSARAQREEGESHEQTEAYVPADLFYFYHIMSYFFN